MFSTEAVQEHWLGNFVLNLVGYGLIILPSALLIRRWKNSTLVKAGNGPLYGTLHLLVFGNAEDDPLKAVEEEVKKGGGSGGTTETRPFPLPYYAHLIFCIVGLQVSYLIWGVLQESVMTRAYGGDKFTDSQFLVFVNRALALVVAAIYIALFKQPRHTAPFYKYAYPSISNTLSSWCQYEALKFVSFPTQVLAKASKTIPVMLTDKVVSNSTYPCYEYFTASLMSIGVTIFMLSADPDVDQHRSVQTTLAGIVILIGYVAFDSFTSNFESKVFKDYKVSSIQMMLGKSLLGYSHCLLASVPWRFLFRLPILAAPLRVCRPRASHFHLLGCRPAVHFPHHSALWSVGVHPDHDDAPGNQYSHLLHPLWTCPLCTSYNRRCVGVFVSVFENIFQDH